MKKAFCLLILLSVTKVGYSQEILEIQFQNLKSESVFLLNTETLKQDTLIVKNHILEYDKRLDRPTLFHMVVDGYNNKWPINLILSKEKTELIFKAFIKSKEISGIYPIDPIFIKDPNQNHVFYDFYSSWGNFFEAIMKLSPSDDSDQFLEERKVAYYSFLNSCDSKIRNTKDYLVSAVIINFLVQENLLPLETLQKFYNYLSPNIKEGFYGIKIGEYAGKGGMLQPGKLAPKFEVTDINKQKYNLANLKGKKVLLHFWSSSCAPCIKEAPELLKLSEENNGHLVIINVSTDTDQEKWIKGIERAGISTMINVCDFYGLHGKMAQAYAIRFIPAYYLINEEGRIVLKGTLRQVVNEIKK